MQFLHQPLTWAFLLVLVPLIIHLINLMRHQRVKWAAMEFLLQSYKKHRRWIWLKQLLLLATRMLAVAAIVAMLAQLVTRQQWTQLLGGSTTHHYVLLDDSLSMGDRSGGATVFDRALQAVGEIAAAQQALDGRHKLTLIRYSRAVHAAPGAAGTGPAQGAASPRIAQAADLNAEPLDARFAMRLEERRRDLAVSQLAVDPGPALEIVKQLVEVAADESPQVYLVSDFRAADWASPAEVRAALERLSGAGASVQLVRCADRQRPNLAVVDVAPAEGTRAAGVPLFVDVKVQNFGPLPAEQVSVRLFTTFLPAAGAPEQSLVEAKSEELPAQLIERIGAGETVTRRFQVYFPAAGRHVVRAELPGDAVDADNRRWSVIDLPAGVPVLVIDGDPAGAGTYYLSSAFRPGTRASTGIRPDAQGLTYLRDASPEALAGYRAIYLSDVDRLDARSVANLEAYVRAGGGVAFFLGPEANLNFLNEWYEEGRGLFPVRLERQDLLGPAAEDGVPDLQATDHPLFRVLLGDRNPFVRGLRIPQYLRAEQRWTPPADSTIQVLASLHNGQPLVVARRFGQGRVVVFLTTLAPIWNNWAHEPSFVVVMLQLQAYLAALEAEVDPRRVGSTLEVQLDAQRFRPEVRFALPPLPNIPEVPVIERIAVAGEADRAPPLVARLGGGDGQTDRAGVYQVLPMTRDGQVEVQRYALNVDPAEGDLALIESRQLAEGLQPARVQVHEIHDLQYQAAEQQGFSWSQLLLFGLVGLLLGEQLLAYSASYHPSPRVAA